MRVFVPTTNHDRIRMLFQHIPLSVKLYAIYGCGALQQCDGYIVTDEKPIQFAESLDYFIL